MILPHQEKTRNSGIKVLLTNREKEVLYFLTQGFTDKEIGKKLFLSRSTIKTHRKNLILKFDARNSCHLVYLSFSMNVKYLPI